MSSLGIIVLMGFVSVVICIVGVTKQLEHVIRILNDIRNLIEDIKREGGDCMAIAPVIRLQRFLPKRVILKILLP
jgi:hypothetical protein